MSGLWGLAALVAWAVAAWTAGVVADERGRSFAGWLVIGLVVPLLAPLYVALLPRGTHRMQTCEHCLEQVPELASRCRCCGGRLEPDLEAAAR